VQDLEEPGLLHPGVVVADGARSEERAKIQVLASGEGVADPGAVALLQVEDDSVAVGKEVAGKGAVNVGGGDGWQGRGRHFENSVVKKLRTRAEEEGPAPYVIPRSYSDNSSFFNGIATLLLRDDATRRTSRRGW